MAKLVGIYGKMHTGKTTLAIQMVEDHHPWVHRLSFAQKVKDTVVSLGMEPTRENFQKMGQGLRDVWPDVWVNAIRNDKGPDALSTYGTNWTAVFDDMRYHNEFEFIKERGIVIKLTASDDIRWGRFHTSTKYDPDTTREQWDAYQGHQSEVDMDDIPDAQWDMVINTDNVGLDGLAVVADRIWGRVW